MRHPELGWLHARADHLELLAIEAAVHLRVTRRDLRELESLVQAEALSAVDRTRLRELLDREATLRNLAADVAQEMREVKADIRTGTVLRHGEVLKS
ncbi:MAG: hypothetical protein O2820_22610 [Planctomycetota bacterium]|nr:hypothetical protein [Planctomycetota bacterium]MDA1252011.1 hypothetical protein [Planctomycetota bacterium]